MKEAVDEIIDAIVSEPTSAGAAHPPKPAPGAAPLFKPEPAPGESSGASSSGAEVATPHHVFLIDGSGFIFRAYFARAKDPKAERVQRKSDGMATAVVMHFS